MVFHVVLASLTAHFSGSDHNYLSDRYQIVKVNGVVSTSSRELHYGTAQLYTIHKEVLPSRFPLLGFVDKTAAQSYLFAFL